MGLETGTYISDLVATNPLSTDLQSQGDDHLRLIKNTAKNTFPNGNRAQYFKRSTAKTTNYVIAATDMEQSFPVDASGGAVSLTLPTLGASNDGWCCEVLKSDSSANAVTVVGTINGETNIVIADQYQAVRFLWTGTAWLALYPMVTRNGTFVLPVGSTATRPASPQKGALWYNNTTPGLEFSDGSSWFSLLTTLAGAQMSYGAVLNGTIVESHTGNAVTFALKTLAGNDPSTSDPVLVAFRNSAAGTGNYVFRQVTTALNITISAGSTTGFSSGVPGKLWHLLIDDGGTVKYGVINCLSGLNIYPLGQVPLISSTADDGLGGSDSAQVCYTKNGVAAVTSKPYVILGYTSYESGLVTAGNWAASPTNIQLFGAGVPLPGQTVRKARASTSTATVLPNASTTQTSLSCSINKSSNCNLVDIMACGEVQSSGTGSALMRLSRGTGPTYVGAAIMTGIPSGGEESVTLIGTDSPNTTSNPTYYVYGSQVSGSGTPTWLDTTFGTQTGVMLLDEISV